MNDVLLALTVLSVLFCWAAFWFIFEDYRQEKMKALLNSPEHAELMDFLSRLKQEDHRWFVEGEYTVDEYLKALNYGERNVDRLV